MTAKELMEQLIGEENLGTPTVDTCKHGNPLREVRKVGVCLTATAEVLRQARTWGTDLLITHECTYYDHLDHPRPDPITARKQELLESCAFTLWRFHDFQHRGNGSDGIHEGFIKKLGWDCTFDGGSRVELKMPSTPRALAKNISEMLGIEHPRIAGNPDLPVKKVALYLGACGSMFDAFCSDDAELAIAGELCEWREVEPIRDAGQFGIPKALLLLGHAASEAPGMEMLAEKLRVCHPELEVRYFDCGALVTYPEDC